MKNGKRDQQGRVALVTGGAKGIGRAIALALAEDGWSVALCYRTSAAQGEATALAIRAKGARALACRADVSDPRVCEGLLSNVEQEFGHVDALIHCAGPYHRVPLMEETVDGWRAMFEGNLHPVFYLSRIAARGMMERRWGRILTFSMANADRMVAQPDVTAHYIAKSGVLILTRTLAKVLAPYNITVNSISPGFIDSGSTPVEEMTPMLKHIPVGYIGNVADAVAAARFLLSEDARYVTGGNLHLSGGWGI